MAHAPVRRSSTSAAVALILALGACSSGGTPEVTPAPSPTSAAPVAEAEPTPTPTPEEESTGTREHPLAIGEARKLSEASAWTVSVQSSNLDATAAILAADEWAPRPAEGETFVVASISVTVDGAALAAQGVDLANEGAQPWWSLDVRYVAADGSTSYSSGDGTSCYTKNMLYDQGTVYQDGATVAGDICIAVPTDRIPGGLWRIANTQNDYVWVASS